MGNGFPVRSLFSYQEGDEFDPFLLLDDAGPYEFSPAEAKRGVGEHPHRGFETVTIVYQGELEHGDSSGAKGSVGPGDVQWMKLSLSRRSDSTASTSHGCCPNDPMSSVKRCPIFARMSPAAHHLA